MATDLPQLDNLDVRGRRVLVRVDWNVPLAPTGEVLDTFRIAASLPTIAALRAAGATEITLLSHLGNPVVRPREDLAGTIAGNRRLRLRPIAVTAARLLKLPEPDELPDELPRSPLPAYRLAPDLQLLENLRFHPGELAGDMQLGRSLSKLGNAFVNEAFSESHRAVASLVELPKFLPAAAGLRLTDELSHLDRFRDKPDKPVVFVLGGAKVEDKILLIDALLKKVDAFLLGGVMANTFLAAQGTDMRKSLVENQRLDAAKDLFNRAPQKFILPLDFTWDRDRALDIGPQTVALYTRYLTKAKLIFWNGPMGWTSAGRELFARGSIGIAKAIAASSATSVAAGGDTLGLLDTHRLDKECTFLSTGGGATLTYLAGGEMPGLAALAARKLT